MSSTERDFSAFVSRAWPGLVRTAVLLTGDHASAEDLVQSALVRTHRRWRFIRHRDNPEAYVRRAMVNLQRDWWRRGWSREHPVDRLPEARVEQMDGLSGVLDADSSLSRALYQLPPRMRATLVLRFYEDMSEQQTARVLGCSVGSVKSQTSRGLARLRTVLAEGEEHREKLFRRNLMRSAG
ncbi:MAG: hypothetical protein QG608_49 [Actinomycetota bacterium]|nr:hypothetical protein [Actinomycetota bacterium]